MSTLDTASKTTNEKLGGREEVAEEGGEVITERHYGGNMVFVTVTVP